MNSKIAGTFFILIVSLFLSVNGLYQHNMVCENDHKMCILKTKDGNIRVAHIKCNDETDDCKESIVLGENHHVYDCKNLNTRSSVCKDLFRLDELLKGLNEESSDEETSSYDGSFKSEPKRALPFESLNYGRRKRQLPFETLNYGKRACDCSHVAKSAFTYGKRGLPFDALNYGKRSGVDIPIDGYIIGKRQE